MFTLYKSQTINNLIKKIFKKKKNNLVSNPLQNEIFITNNKATSKLVKILITKYTGISANIKFKKIDFLLYKIIKKIKKKKYKTKKFFIKKKKIIWKIFKTFKKKKKKKKYFIFSEKISEIFKKYLIYRKNWIKNLKKKNISKQKIYIKIWKKIIFKKKYNFYKLLNFFKKNLKKIKKDIPKKIFILNITSIKPLYLLILYQISKITKIYILFSGPNYFYKKKILNYKKIKNNLLKNFGKLGYEYINILIKKKIKIINFYKTLKNKNILNNIKNKITKIKKNNKIKKNDKSLQIYSCNSKYQEIENLKIQISNILEKKKNITPKDIIIYAKNIKKYKFYIKTIFNSKKKIPYSILNKKNKKIEILFKIIKFLLNIKNIELNNKNIFYFLEKKYILKKFLINKNEYIFLKKIIEKTKIFSGLDNKHLKKKKNPEIFQNTWLFGINKIMLNISINKKNKIWNNILISNLTKNKNNLLIGKLIYFIKTLKNWKKKISKKKKIKKWKNIFNKIIKFFIPKKKNLKKNIKKIKKKWENFISLGIKEKNNKKIHIHIFKNFFLKKIKKMIYKNKKENFISNKIKFCNIEYIKNISFKVIYILGVNNKNFPKEQKFDINDITQYHKKNGDINVFKKDCYNILELILSAKKYFYLSYVGYNERTHKKKNKSIIIKELKKYIYKNFKIKKNIIKKKYKKNIFNNMIIYNEKYNNYKKLKYNKKKNKEKYYIKKKKKKKIKIKNLLNFWNNPIKYFYNKTLKIYLQKNIKKKKKNEPFKINSIKEYILKKKILKKIIKKKNINLLYKKYLLKGSIPYGYIGKNIWNNNIKKILTLLKNIYINFKKKKYKKINLLIKKKKLKGKIYFSKNNGILKWNPKKININDTIKLWIKHLIYCSYKKKGKSIIIGINNTKWKFKNIKKKKAIKYLNLYIKGYIQGKKKPLLITKSAICCLNNLYYNKKKKNKKIFLKRWKGNNFIQGEKKDIYIQKIIPNINSYLIKKLLKIAKFWYFPIIKNKINEKKKYIK
ncbi:exodeoxyribonuclease V subunit gamma [Buchnera aphidicola]|uniref:exodeoxyribonuclease V subunit gamma n=1 Tax=Buchnera aphidicola TaxID=9 RepID=UPI0031B8A1B2